MFSTPPNSSPIANPKTNPKPDSIDPTNLTLLFERLAKIYVRCVPIQLYPAQLNRKSMDAGLKHL